MTRRTDLVGAAALRRRDGDARTPTPDVCAAAHLDEAEASAPPGQRLAPYKVGTDSAQTGAPFAGIVDLEGGGMAPHPLGGGVVGLAPTTTTGELP